MFCNIVYGLSFCIFLRWPCASGLALWIKVQIEVSAALLARAPSSSITHSGLVSYIPWLADDTYVEPLMFSCSVEHLQRRNTYLGPRVYALRSSTQEKTSDCRWRLPTLCHVSARQKSKGDLAYIVG